MFYGNIGSKDRLDFTVVGPAVNEVSRIAAMCRSVDQRLLVSSAFAAALGEARSRLVSVGRYALRGVGRPPGLIHTRIIGQQAGWDGVIASSYLRSRWQSHARLHCLSGGRF